MKRASSVLPSPLQNSGQRWWLCCVCALCSPSLLLPLAIGCGQLTRAEDPRATWCSVCGMIPCSATCLYILYYCWSRTDMLYSAIVTRCSLIAQVFIRCVFWHFEKGHSTSMECLVLLSATFRSGMSSVLGIFYIDIINILCSLLLIYHKIVKCQCMWFEDFRKDPCCYKTFIMIRHHHRLTEAKNVHTYFFTRHLLSFWVFVG